MCFHQIIEIFRQYHCSNQLPVGLKAKKKKRIERYDTAEIVMQTISE